MSAPWAAKPLESLSQTIAMGPFGSSIKKETYVDTGIPVINGKHLHEVRLNDAVGYGFIREDHADTLSRANAYPGDVIITHRGTLGQVSLIPESSQYDRYVISQSQMLVRPDPTLLNSAFLTYYLHSHTGQNQLLSFATQTGVPALAQPTASLKQLAVPIPPLALQEAIVGVLGALDDKIAANKRQTAIIDEYLRSIFAQLTKDASIVSLAEVSSINPTQIKAKSSGSLRYIDIASVNQGSINLPDPIPWSSAPSRARRKVQSLDTIWSTVRPNRRAHALILEEDPSLVASTGLAVLRPHEKTQAMYFYEATKHPRFSAYLESVAEGSAYPAVKSQLFNDAPLLWANENKRTTFETIAAPLRHLQASLDEENRHLTTTRNTLLPQLMSGRLEVKGLEERSRSLDIAGNQH